MIYLLRHGLDDERYIGGWSDVDLIPEGVNQIIDSTDFLKNSNLEIKKIISSDIKRAVTTSKIVNKVLKVDLEITDILRELDKGIYTGVLNESLSNEEKDFIKNIDIYTKYPQGECMIDMYKRCKLFLEKCKFNDVLLVTHRGVINMFYYILNDIPLDMNKKRFNVTHGSIHEMDINKKYIRRIY